MAKLPLLNVQAAREGKADAAQQLYAQLAAKLESLDREELGLLRSALLRLADGAEAQHAFAEGKPKQGPKPSDGWQRDYRLWLEFNELADAEVAAGRRVVKARIYRQIGQNNPHEFDRGELRPLGVDTVKNAVTRIERAMVEHEAESTREAEQEKKGIRGARRASTR